MDYSQLIGALIGVMPGLLTAFENWFKKNPRLQGETDEQYAARINADTLKMASDTTAINNQVSS